jgi:hypothetical protein
MRRVVIIFCMAVMAGACSGGGEEPEATSTAGGPLPTTTDTQAALVAASLPALALSAQELPRGYEVNREGFVPTREPVVAAYRRSFDPGGEELGDSTVDLVSTDVVLFQNERDAAGGLAALAAALTGADVQGQFAELVEASAGVDVSRVRGQTLATPELGDGTLVARASFRTDDGPRDAIFLVTRVGRLQGAVFVLGRRDKLRLEDAGRALELLIARLQAASGQAEA